MSRAFVRVSFLFLLALCTASAGEGDVIRVGDKAPFFRGTASDGSSIKLDDYTGKPVVVIFFATWCDGCKQELPRVERDLQKRFRNEGLVVLGIGRGHRSGELANFKRERNFSFPLIEDPRREIYSKYASDYIPRCYLIGKDGTIKHAITGIDLGDFESFKRRVEEEVKR